MVGHVAGNRATTSPAHARRMGCRSDPELDASLPKGVVVVGAVQAERVEPFSRPRPPIRHSLCASGGFFSDGPVDQSIDHDRLEPEFTHRIFDLGDALFRAMHGDHGHGGHTILVAAVEFGVVDIQGAARDLPEFILPDGGGREGPARVENGEVDAEIIESFGKQPRQVRCRPVESSGSGQCPPRRSRRPGGLALLLAQGAPGSQDRVIVVEPPCRFETSGQVAAA